MKEQSAWLAAKETRPKQHAGSVPFLTSFLHISDRQRCVVAAQCSLPAVIASA